MIYSSDFDIQEGTIESKVEKLLESIKDTFSDDKLKKEIKVDESVTNAIPKIVHEIFEQIQKSYTWGSGHAAHDEKFLKHLSEGLACNFEVIKEILKYSNIDALSTNITKIASDQIVTKCEDTSTKGNKGKFKFDKRKLTADIRNEVVSQAIDEPIQTSIFFNKIEVEGTRVYDMLNNTVGILSKVGHIGEKDSAA